MFQNVQPTPWYGSIKKPNMIPKVPGVPVIPPLPEPGPENQYHAQCGECGVLIPKGAWGYSCSRSRCPIFPQVTC